MSHSCYIHTENCIKFNKQSYFGKEQVRYLSPLLCKNECHAAQNLLHSSYGKEYMGCRIESFNSYIPYHSIVWRILHNTVFILTVVTINHKYDYAEIPGSLRKNFFHNSFILFHNSFICFHKYSFFHTIKKIRQMTGLKQNPPPKNAPITYETQLLPMPQ